MHIIRTIVLLLSLSQLVACAVISKEQCLDADWRQIGYGVGKNGNTDKTSAFDKRKRTCAKHNASANWREFELGHSDGIVAFCQLDNAVKLGVDGAVHAINKRVCSERDYQGFHESFNTGYKLYILNSRVNEIDITISHAYNQISHHKNNLHRINKKLASNDVNKNERKSLISERKRIRRQIKHLARDINWEEQHLHQALYARDQYADYLDDYIFHLDNRFIDPRDNKSYRQRSSGF